MPALCTAASAHRMSLTPALLLPLSRSRSVLGASFIFTFPLARCPETVYIRNDLIMLCSQWLPFSEKGGQEHIIKAINCTQSSRPTPGFPPSLMTVFQGKIKAGLGPPTRSVLRNRLLKGDCGFSLSILGAQHWSSQALGKVISIPASLVKAPSLRSTERVQQQGTEAPSPPHTH